MFGFCPLASGSRGNSIYIGTKNCRILIDAGINTKTIADRLTQIGVDIATLDAVIVSHEHTDHIQGLKVLTTKYGIPVLANAETAKAIAKTFDDCPKFKIFTTGEPFEFKGLEITPFQISHDAVEPVAFTFKTESCKIGVCTDLGIATRSVRNHLKECDILYVEANHEIDLVMASSRPAVYKQRVLGRSGHLSNDACGTLIADIACTKLQHVYLAHLSKECNRPELAKDKIEAFLEKQGLTLSLTVAQQDCVSRATLFHDHDVS